MACSKIIRNLDLNGSKITLYKNGSKSNKTFVGGLATLLMSVLFCLLVAGFGEDFIYRTNPYQFVSEINDFNYFKVNFTYSQFVMAFRYEDGDSIQIDPEGLSLYFNFYFQS